MPGALRTPAAFDVESFRAAGRRVVLREVGEPTVVLGSTQSISVVDADHALRRGVTVVRRRSGGGAVLLLPGEQVWADLWVPRTDPLWSAEPRASALVAGEWWARALRASHGGGGSELLAVHRGASVPAPGSDVVCFAGVGPGEVLAEGRKLVGLAQWRSREGALFQACCYRRWDPATLTRLLGVDEALAEVTVAAVGLDELAGEAASVEAVVASLLGALPPGPAWAVTGP